MFWSLAYRLYPTPSLEDRGGRERNYLSLGKNLRIKFSIEVIEALDALRLLDCAVQVHVYMVLNLYSSKLVQEATRSTFPSSLRLAVQDMGS
jgi:hypothetical protein